MGCAGPSGREEKRVEPDYLPSCLVSSPTRAPAGKVELHGKPVEVEHSVPKRQR